MMDERRTRLVLCLDGATSDSEIHNPPFSILFYSSHRDMPTQAMVGSEKLAISGESSLLACTVIPSTGCSIMTVDQRTTAD